MNGNDFDTLLIALVFLSVGVLLLPNVLHLQGGALKMMVEDLLTMYAPFVGAGFLLGCLPMLAGLGIQAVINIFKKI